MFLRAYLRASTDDQDAERSREALDQFAAQYGERIANYYIENASGATTERAELQRMLKDSQPGDVVLVESVDRLTRLPWSEWQTIRGQLESKGLRVVALDLPTSHAAMQNSTADEFTARMLDAVNATLIETMAAIARKDYEQRRERQRQGIDKAKARGIYQGRPNDERKRKRIRELLDAGFSIRKTAELAPASTRTVRKVRHEEAAL